MNEQSFVAGPSHHSFPEFVEMPHKHHRSSTKTHRHHHRQPRKSPTQISEHGHDLTLIEPMTRHRGQSVNTFFNGLFTTIIAIATLGTSITFSYVLSNQTVPPPVDAHFSEYQVQLFLAISWLFFLLALAFSATGSTMLTFFKKHWINDWDGVHGRTSQLTVQMYAVVASAIMGGLIVAAFVFMCLVVVAYQPVVGWISLGFTGVFAMVILGGISNQVPWPWMDNKPASDKEAMV